MNHKKYIAGSIVYADLSPTVGAEIGGSRPVMILQQNGPLVTVLPFTYEGLSSQIRTIDIKRIRGTLPEMNAEPLKSITADGLCAEGLGVLDKNDDSFARDYFKQLWNSTIPKDKFSTYGWQGNPWVWVYQFERCKRPEGFV